MKRIILLACLLLPIFASAKAEATPLADDQVTLIYALAHSVSGIPLPPHAPVVHLTTAAAIDKMLTDLGVCPRGCPSVKAAQIEELIYVDRDLDFSDIQNAGILFHEMVHYLQYMKKYNDREAMGEARREQLKLILTGEAETCEEWREREITAYHLQNLVLNKAGARMVQSPAWPTCPGEAAK